jgi:hypothetical protein
MSLVGRYAEPIVRSPSLMPCEGEQVAKGLLAMQHAVGTLRCWIDHEWHKGREFPSSFVAQLSGL